MRVCVRMRRGGGRGKELENPGKKGFFLAPTAAAAATAKVKLKQQELRSSSSRYRA